MTPKTVPWLSEDFSQPDKPAVEALPPEPTFSVAELSAARLEAWNDGYLAAAMAGSHTHIRDGHKIFAELLARSDDIDEKLEHLAERNAASIARWLVMTFVTTFPSLSHHAMQDRTRAVGELLQSTLRSQAKIDVRSETGPTVSFSTMHEVCRQIEIQQLEDPTGDITIAWQQGEAQINPSRTWDDIQSAIMPLAAGEPAADSFLLTITQAEPIRHVG